MTKRGFASMYQEHLPASFEWICTFHDKPGHACYTWRQSEDQARQWLKHQRAAGHVLTSSVERRLVTSTIDVSDQLLSRSDQDCPWYTSSVEPLLIPMSEDGREALLVPKEAGDWALYLGRQKDLITTLRLGIAEHDRDYHRPGIVIRELMCHAISSQYQLDLKALRRLPLARMTAAVNQPRYIEELQALIVASGTRGRSKPANLNAYWSNQLNYLPLSVDNPPVVVANPGGNLRKPDSFYEAVVRAFGWFATISNHPAQDMAEANKVPVTTVHRWIKEARNRRLLPATGRSENDTPL